MKKFILTLATLVGLGVSFVKAEGMGPPSIGEYQDLFSYFENQNIQKQKAETNTRKYNDLTKKLKIDFNFLSDAHDKKYIDCSGREESVMFNGGLFGVGVKGELSFVNVFSGIPEQTINSIETYDSNQNGKVDAGDAFALRNKQNNVLAYALGNQWNNKQKNRVCLRALRTIDGKRHFAYGFIAIGYNSCPHRMLW